MWVEHLARRASSVDAYPFPFVAAEFDYRPLLDAIVADRIAGRDVAEIARAFHAALATAIGIAGEALDATIVVASGGVFQNALLVELLDEALGARLWLNRSVPRTMEESPSAKRL